jgi:cell division protein FtsB
MPDTSTETVNLTAGDLVKLAKNWDEYGPPKPPFFATGHLLDAMADHIEELAAERDKWHAGWMEAEAKVSELEAERVVLKAEVERLQSVNELMCAQIDSLPQPEPDLLKRQLRKVADKRVRADLQENTDG